MSTRSIIGTANDNGFTGRYCHWDGYPTCRGQELLDTYKELGSAQAVIDYAIRPDATGYWSSYNVPSKVAADALLPTTVACDLCNGTGNRTDTKLHKPNWCNGCDGTGQARNREVAESWRECEDTLVTSKEDVGCEYAYLLSETGITVLSYRYSDGSQAVGMCGAVWDEGTGYWHHEAEVAWTEVAPDWAGIEERANADVDA